MRKTFLLVLLAALSGSAVAEWVRVGSNDKFKSYADPASLSKNGNKVKMWFLYDFNAIQKISPHKQYLSGIGQEEFDCKEEKDRTIAISYHSGNMVGGEAIYSEAEPSRWMPITPGSTNETMWKYACGRK